jgi:ribonuclease P protein component
VYDHGSRLTSASFALFWAPCLEPAQGPRAGFTTPRALGNSVIRNRIRRRMREAVRMELPRFSDRNVDLVFHPRRPVLEVDLDRLRGEVERVLRKCRTS